MDENAKTPEEGVQFDLSAQGESTPDTPETPATPQPNEEGVTFDLSEPEKDTVETKEPEQTGETPPANTESSLTPKPESTETQTVSGQEIHGELQLTDEMVAKYLSEKRGEEVSLDTLFDKPEVTQAPEIPDDIKAIMEWREKNPSRPMSDWVKFQKDYDKLSDEQAVREYLELKYPSFDAEDISIEMAKLTPGEMDEPDEVRMKNHELKKLGIEARSELNKMRIQFGEPTESDKSRITPEIKQKLDLLEEVKKQHDTVVKANEKFDLGLKQASSSLDSLPLELPNDVKLSFNLDQATKQGLPDYIKNPPHWKNPDGTDNHAAIAADAAFIQNKEKIFSMIAKQFYALGQKDTVADTKNITLDQDKSKPGGQVEGNHGPVIESSRGLESFMGVQGMRIRKFGNK